MHSKSILVTTALAIVLAACSHRGDFGRTEPSFFEDTVLPVTRSLLGHAHGGVTSNYPLSEDETTLRALSRGLTDPERRATYKKTLLRQAHAAGVANNNYEKKRRLRHDVGLEQVHYNSPFKQHHALLSAVKNDIRLTERFIDMSRKVYKTDNIRYRRLVSSNDLSGDEIRNVTGRLAENKEIVAATLLVLENRLSEYRLDLKQMKLRAPGALERDIAYAIETLKKRTGTLHSKTSYWARERMASKPSRRHSH
jgi:hypothetical protein